MHDWHSPRSCTAHTPQSAQPCGSSPQTWHPSAMLTHSSPGLVANRPRRTEQRPRSSSPRFFPIFSFPSQRLAFPGPLVRILRVLLLKNACFCGASNAQSTCSPAWVLTRLPTTARTSCFPVRRTAESLAVTVHTAKRRRPSTRLQPSGSTSPVGRRARASPTR